MSEWARVKWTEAGQIAQLLRWDDDLGEDARAAPAAFFGRLRQAGRLADAALFLGQALPRYETVAWGARVVRDLRRDGAGRGPEADALKAALLWVQDPSEARRRAAFDAAQRARDDSPERMAALAAFFSGGSMTPADCPPVPAPKEAAGRFAAGAVLLAAARAPDQARALDQALDTGAAIASLGLEAGSA